MSIVLGIFCSIIITSADDGPISGWRASSKPRWRLTIAAVLLTFFAGFHAIRTGWLKRPGNLWTFLAMTAPVAVYGVLGLLTANLNIGLRHAFPIYPFVFVAAGLSRRTPAA